MSPRILLEHRSREELADSIHDTPDRLAITPHGQLPRPPGSVGAALDHAGRGEPVPHPCRGGVRQRVPLVDPRPPPGENEAGHPVDDVTARPAHGSPTPPFAGRDSTGT